MIKVKAQEDSSQMIYYQKPLITKGIFQLYGYSSYDLYWENESGFGILITINNKRKRYGKYTNKPINNWDWSRNDLWIRSFSRPPKKQENTQRFEIPSKRYSFSQILRGNDYR
jgi:hypothetical protein